MLRKIIAATIFILLATTITACKVVIIPAGPGTPGPEDMVNTAAAQTVSALGTEIATGRTGTWLPPKAPTITMTPTAPPAVATNTTTPTATPGPDCNRASFEKDVTIEDGSTILPNSVFTKIWELKNSGTCAWNSSYSVIFAGQGTAMGGPANAPILKDGQVKPGETVRVSVTMRSPGEPGDYEGYWSLQSGDGQVFGIGPGGTTPFFVKIHVAGEFSFAEHLCSAQWSSGAGNLPCPGTNGDSKGYALPLKNLTLEDNKEREGAGWQTAPQAVANGFIVGKFPAMMVPEHSDFRATLSCAPGESGCYVHFKVTYRIDNGAEQTLGEWNEGTEGGVTEAVTDLDAVAGRSTEFFFYVYIVGNPAQSKGLWFNPRIIKN